MSVKGQRVEHEGRLYEVHPQGSWRVMRVYEVRKHGRRPPSLRRVKDPQVAQAVTRIVAQAMDTEARRMAAETEAE